MATIEWTSSFAETQTQIKGRDFLYGELFEHYQKQLTPQEESIFGLRCLGYSYKEIADALHTPQARIKQWERSALWHMRQLYTQGK